MGISGLGTQTGERALWRSAGRLGKRLGLVQQGQGYYPKSSVQGHFLPFYKRRVLPCNTLGVSWGHVWGLGEISQSHPESGDFHGNCP